MSSSYDTQLGFTSSTIASASGDIVLREFSGMQTANCDRLIWWVFLPKNLVFIQHSFYFAKMRGIYECAMNILLAHGEIPASGSVHPSRWLPPWPEGKIEQRVTGLSTWAKWGDVWIDAWVCLHYWVVIWVAGYFIFFLYCTVYGVCHRQDTLWPYGRILV